MPAELTASDLAQNPPADKMNNGTQDRLGELPQPVPAFSYAQAAKGRSPSVPSTLPAGKAQSDTTEVNDKKNVSSEARDAIAGPGNTHTKRTASEARAPHVVDISVNGDQSPDESSEVKDPKKEALDTEEPAVAGQSQPGVSAPSISDDDTTSTSTLLKEEDAFSVVNGSSDSTSDKQSQTSMNGTKPHERPGVEKEDNVISSWDEEVSVAPPALKEAPPPQVNVWKQRSAAKQQGAMPTQQPKPANPIVGGANTSEAMKGSSAVVEPKKPEIRRKTRSGPGPVEDPTPSGNGKDTSKTVEAVDRNGATLMAPPPPPPGDAMSWPTPDSSAGDGKKKSQDRPEKGEKDVGLTPKPHGKDKWVAVPFVPSAVFNTPVPTSRRGGRAPRGGREADNRGRNVVPAHSGSEKPSVAGAKSGHSPTSGGQELSKANLASTANASAAKPKRATSAGPTTPREQRKSVDGSVHEKRKDGEFAISKPNQTASNVSRRPSAPTTSKDSQMIYPSGTIEGSEPSWRSTIVNNHTQAGRTDQVALADANVQKTNGHERRGEGFNKTAEYNKDFYGNGSSRERGESRPERGRGGYRGRGGSNHAYYNPNMANGHGFSNGYTSQHQPSAASPSKLQSNHDRLSTQSHGFYQSAHHQPRHHRTNSRSQSISHASPYGRFSNGHHGGPAHLPNLQTDLANEYGYLPAHQGAMTAVPFNPYAEPPSVFGMVNLQMDYYFSVENLCKDIFLRSHMDSQGFVFLEVLANFNRIKQLTQDMDLIRHACIHSQAIEYVNVDGIDRVRARENWDRWVLKREERNVSAQNDGPSLQLSPQYPQPSSYDPNEKPHTVSPRTHGAGISTDNILYQSLNGIGPSFNQGNMTAEPTLVDTSVIRTPLSAAASEFSFSTRSKTHRNFSSPDPHGSETSVFTDAQVEKLMVTRRPLSAVTSVPPPFHTPSSRTFSNGSIDGRSINDELSRFAERQSRFLNDREAVDSADSPIANRSRSPFAVGSPTRLCVSPPVLWIKDRDTPIETLNLPPEWSSQLYLDFRRDALKQREQSPIDKENFNMQGLFGFWSHFLVRNFNASMYEEFHRLALEDEMQRKSTFGMRELLQYYDKSILSDKPVSDDRIAQDFVELVIMERFKTERPLFGKLRAVWRNGAYNVWNRSKLTKFIDPDLKAELDR